ncbi:MAG: T9SS type A sorting domain-containing protein [candidate division Zixibacteria bacterium]|nr:T9SS type A sorting domain-containing protein [candidate division Zixibacteria bacterium]
MRSMLMVLVIFLLGANLFAQAPDFLWGKEYGDKPAWDGYDQLYGATPTSDGGFALNGNSSTWGDTVKSDQWVIKINSDGDTLWTRTFGDFGRTDYGRDIIETYDSGLVICGHGRIATTSEDYRIRLFKTDSLGNQIWEKDFVAANGFNTEQIIETSDSGFAIVGWTDDKDVFLFRADSLGDSVWTQTYGGASHDIGYGVCQTSDDGFMIVGSTESYGSGSYDFYIIRTNSIGDTIWTAILGTEGYESGQAIAKTHDGHYLIAGSIVNTNTDIYLLKMREIKFIDWQKTVGQADANDSPHGITLTADNGFLIAGSHYSVTNSENDMYLLKIDSDGNSLWSYTHEDDFTHDEGRIAHQTADSDIFLFGTKAVSSSGSYRDYWALKFDAPMDSRVDISETKPHSFRLSQNHPNPFNPITEIEFDLPRTTNWTLTIFNIIGQRVESFTGHDAAGLVNISWDASDFTSGIYFYRLETDEFTNTKKMVLLK